MKLFLLVALVACAYAEPEAESKADADAQFLYSNGLRAYGSYGYAAPRVYSSSYVSRPYTTSYAYSAPYAYGNRYTAGYASPYTTYGYNRLFKRDAEAEAEPEAQYFANTYGGFGYSGYPYAAGYSAYSPYTTYSTAFPSYTTGYTAARYTAGYASPYTTYGYNRLFKREAEAESEGQFYGYPSTYAYGSYAYPSAYNYASVRPYTYATAAPYRFTNTYNSYPYSYGYF